MSRTLATLVLGVLAAFLGTTLTVPAQAAAVLSSTGERCTVLGSAGDDVLRGTDRRDVICGRGGDDTIRARGGNDLVDGGAGSDTVLAGDGADTVRGGRGGDEVAGGAGADAITGGAGGDTVVGDAGGDDLDGDGGNDDLTGGSGADVIDGDGGTNWCTVDAADTGVRCVHDLVAPTVHSGSFGVSRVDVTERNGSVEVRGHVTDDTGARDVRLVAFNDTDTYVAHSFLVGGTVRDGWWEGSFGVPRWSPPGSMTLTVEVTDRVGRRTYRTFPDVVVEVVDRNPDLEMPQVQLLAPATGAQYDVRSADADVVVKARITDDVSGVALALMCVHKPQDGYWANLPCEHGFLVSGDEHDGVWRGVVPVPRGEIGGRWNVAVIVRDSAHTTEERWVGPEIQGADDDWFAPSWVRPFPDGAGWFDVRGVADTNAPVLGGFTMTPTEIDTLASPVAVRFTVQARDVEGIAAAGASLYPLDPQSQVEPGQVDFTLTGGTATDGTWTGRVVVPQGTPPGRYGVQVWLQDVVHFTSWFTPGTADPGYADARELPAESVLTVTE